MQGRADDDESLAAYLAGFERDVLLEWASRSVVESATVRALRILAEAGKFDLGALTSRALRRAAGPDNWGAWRQALENVAPDVDLRKRNAAGYLALLPWQPALAGPVVFELYDLEIIGPAELDRAIDALAAHVADGTFRKPRRHWHRPFEDGEWRVPLAAIAERNARGRAVFLDACLAGATRAPHQNASRDVLQLFDELSPTVDERRARRDGYLLLIGSAATPSIETGLAQAEQFAADGVLSATAYARALEPLICHGSRKRVLATIQTLERLASTDASAAHAVCAVLVCGIAAQSAAGVQARMLDLLEGLAGEASGSRLDDVAAHIAPSLRGRVSSPARALAAKATQTGTSHDAANIDRRIARLAGIGVPRAVFRRTDVPCLIPEQRVQPIDDLEDLLAGILATMRDPGLRFEVDTLIDAISRLCGGPLDASTSIRALVRKVRTAVAKKPRARVADRTVERRWLAMTARAWLDERAPHPGAWPLGGPVFDFESQSFQAPPNNVDLFLERRCDAIAVRVASRISMPLLGTPTHQNGFIDPRVLVERLATYHDNGVETEPCDAILALLRLAPEHRQEALARLGSFPGEFARAFRYALGGDEPAPPTPYHLDESVEDTRRHPIDAPARSGPMEQITDAEREIEGRESLAAFYSAHAEVAPKVRWRLDDDAQSGRLAASLWSAASRARDLQSDEVQLTVAVDSSSETAPIRVVRTPPPPSEVALSDLTLLAYRFHHAGGTVWPANLDPYLAVGCERLAANLHWRYVPFSRVPESDYLENRRFIEPLIDPDVPLTPVAEVVLALGLAAKHPDEARLATDAAIAAIGDGRMDDALLARSLGTISRSEIVNWIRLAGRLAEVARASELHAGTCRVAIVSLIASSPPPARREALELLDLLYELSVLDSTAILPPAAREWLGAFAGAGKTALTARRLLALEHAPDEVRAARVAEQAHAGRVYRAVRWSKAGS